ncbi:hypothetical protein BJ170DRAFT_596484 [Xylariales sp. AK1849]|nr:hypothetical protein BJ170DRAFT_596484 [Xylariales sp. AK1849]
MSLVTASTYNISLVTAPTPLTALFPVGVKRRRPNQPGGWKGQAPTERGIVVKTPGTSPIRKPSSPRAGSSSTPSKGPQWEGGSPAGVVLLQDLRREEEGECFLADLALVDFTLPALPLLAPMGVEFESRLLMLRLSPATPPFPLVSWCRWRWTRYSCTAVCDACSCGRRRDISVMPLDTDARFASRDDADEIEGRRTWMLWSGGTPPGCLRMKVDEEVWNPPMWDSWSRHRWSRSS